MKSKKSEGINDLSNKKKSHSSKKLNGYTKPGNCTTKDSRFKGILNKKLKIFRVSPVYNFTSDKLKFYEKKLNEDVNSKKNSTSNVYKSKFTLNKNLSVSDHFSETLQVEVLKNDSQITYVGHFISCSNTKEDAEGSISLPILLVEGNTYVINAVHSSLCKIFDCDIQPVTFSFYTLISFFVKLLETPRNSIDITQAQITLEYKMPECKANDKIKMSLFLDATTIVFAVIMDSLQNKCQGITNMEIILEFYNKILNHAYKVFKMDLILAELQKICFPDAFLTSDGQLKMSSADAVISTLEVLQSFAPLDAITST